MKRPVLLGNIAGIVLNYILFRIITSLDRTNVEELFSVLKHFLKLNKQQQFNSLISGFLVTSTVAEM